MTKIPLNIPKTSLELTIMQQRMDKLGIETTQGATIDQSKVSQLRSGELKGLDALRSVLSPDGTLTAEGLSKLERGGGFAAVFRGRESTISEKSTREAQAVTMALSGAINTMNAVTKRGTVKYAEIERVGRQLEHANGAVMDMLKSKKLGEVSDPVAEQLVKRFGELESAISGFTQVTSQTREQVAEFASQGSLVDKAAGAVVLKSIGQTQDALRSMQLVARVLMRDLSAPIPSPAPAEQPLLQMSAVVGDGAIGVGSGMYERLAVDAASGLLPRQDVKKVSGHLQTLTHDTKLFPDTLADGVHDLLAAHFLGSRAAASALLEKRGSADRRDQVLASGEAVLALVSQAAKDSGGDEAKFKASLRPFIEDAAKFEGFVTSYAAKPASGEISTPRATASALLDAMHGLDDAFIALATGNTARFERVLPQVRQWVGEARAGVAQSVLGDEPAPQGDVTRLQIAFDHLRRGRDVGSWGKAFGSLLDPKPSTTKNLAAQLSLPPPAASAVQDDPALVARVQSNLSGLLGDLRGLLRMSSGVDGLKGAAA